MQELDVYRDGKLKVVPIWDKYAHVLASYVAKQLYFNGLKKPRLML
jgi:hypothetical protein